MNIFFFCAVYVWVGFFFLKYFLFRWKVLFFYLYKEKRKKAENNCRKRFIYKYVINFRLKCVHCHSKVKKERIISKHCLPIKYSKASKKFKGSVGNTRKIL